MDWKVFFPGISSSLSERIGVLEIRISPWDSQREMGDDNNDDFIAWMYLDLLQIRPMGNEARGRSYDCDHLVASRISIICSDII